MGKSSSFDCQIWFPGPLVWELWLIENGHAGMIKKREPGEELTFEASKKSLKILAMPTRYHVALPFISNAMDGKGLVESAQMYVERQGSGFDAEGAMVEPIFGDPPNTIARVDAPLRKVQQDFECNVCPDLIVPTATLLPLASNSISVWEEFGKPVVAFERNGRAVYYDQLSGGSEIAAEVSRLHFQLHGDGLIEAAEKLTVWSDSHRSFFASSPQWEVINENRPSPSGRSSSYSLQPEWYRLARAQRDESQRKSRATNWIAIGVSSFLFLLVAVIAISALQSRRLKREIARLSPAAERVQEIQANWEEVATAVDPNSSHLEIWRDLFTLPSIGVVEISKLDIRRDGVEVMGKAASASRALKFIDDVVNHSSLASYEWEQSPPGIARDGSAVFELRGVR